MVKRRSVNRYITGAEGLALIDEAVSDARNLLDQVVRSVDEGVKRRGQIRKEQAEGFQALAKFRLDNLDIDASADELSKAEQRASELLAEHERFVAEENVALQTMMSEIEKLEEARADKASALAEAADQQEKRIEAILETLATKPAYQALEQSLKEAAAVTERAARKLELARLDREEKGRPYEEDPLFSYLWARKYRTVDYKAGGLTRMLDGWVDRLCGYEKAHLTFARLTELPDRLAEHLSHVETVENEAEAALKAMEVSALREGGLDEMEAEAETIRAAIRRMDLEIETAEAAHLERSKTHSSALQAQTGPAEEARQVLAEALRKMSFPDLRVLVAQTLELEDDEIVDQLVKLRAEEMQLDLEMSDQEARPKRHTYDLQRIERLRKDYKRASYASRRILIDQTVLEDALLDVRSDHIAPEKALKRIRKTIKHRSKKQKYGGRRHHSRDRSDRYRRDDTAYGLEDVASTVAIELAKAALRHGGRSRGIDIDFGTKRRGSKRRSRSGKYGRGGYKTGDRF